MKRKTAAKLFGGKKGDWNRTKHGGLVRIDADVHPKSEIHDGAVVYGGAKVEKDVIIYSGSRIYDGAEIHPGAQIDPCSDPGAEGDEAIHIHDGASVYGYVYGHTRVSGKCVVIAKYVTVTSGHFKRTPLSIRGWGGPYFANICGPDRLMIGGIEKTMQVWADTALFSERRPCDSFEMRVRSLIFDMARQWFCEYPNGVVEHTEASK